MVLHNPNNWHWVNKDASEWARSYLETELIGTEASEGENKVKISKIEKVDGDVDVSQRKGKVITLFDVKLEMEWTGSTAEDSDVTGTITVPEVAHDTGEDEYVFDTDIHSDSTSKQPLKTLIRNKLTPQLRTKLQTLAPALIAHHGKDLQHAPGQNPSGGSTKPLTTVNSSTAAQANAKASTSTTPEHSTTSGVGGKPALVNTTTVSSNSEYHTTAQELYTTFTDPLRLAAFTRSPPTVFEGARPGAKFALFGGNVSGKYIELEEPRKIVQEWRLQQWPQGHFSRLEIVFDQNDVDAVTVMRVNWSGVPVGQEEVTLRNWREYFERGIKITFGLVLSVMIPSLLVSFRLRFGYVSKVWRNLRGRHVLALLVQLFGRLS
ncbi:hypothetical protein MMC25_005883 [Agyrium rufum]|nr:hypothetical protein [Agyrium rufum]